MFTNIFIGEAKVVCTILHANRKQAFIVGGAVRDILTGKSPHDVDVATDARPEEVTAIFESNGYKVIPIGEKFGTVSVKDPFMHKFVEVTTLRSEGRYSDKRHPDHVRFERDPAKDLGRRDFTINAMALDIHPNKQNPMQQGAIFDPFNGRADIKNKLIRAVGNPEERFQEDPLRMLRMCRFAAKLEFVVEPATLEAAKKFNHLIKEIPAERIKDELFKLLGTENAYIGLNYMRKSGLMKQILPEVMALEFIPQPQKHHKYTAMYHTFETVNAIPHENILLRFAALLHDIGKNEVAPNPPPYFPNHEGKAMMMLPAIFERLKLSNDEEKYVSFIVAQHMDLFLFHHQFNAKSIRRLLSKYGENAKWLPDLITHVEADIVGSGIDRAENAADVQAFRDMVKTVMESKDAFSLNQLAVNGNDLLAIGIPANNMLGAILNYLLKEVIDNPELNTKEKLLEIATVIFQTQKTLKALNEVS